MVVTIGIGEFAYQREQRWKEERQKELLRQLEQRRKEERRKEVQEQRERILLRNENPVFDAGNVLTNSLIKAAVQIGEGGGEVTRIVSESGSDTAGAAVGAAAFMYRHCVFLQIICKSNA